MHTRAMPGTMYYTVKKRGVLLAWEGSCSDVSRPEMLSRRCRAAVDCPALTCRRPMLLLLDCSVPWLEPLALLLEA